MKQVFEYRKTITGNLLDSFGHVNNSVYLEIFEEARWSFIEANGYGLEKIQKLALGPVILELNLKFKDEVLNRETIKVKSRFKGVIKEKIMLLNQEIVKENGKIAALLELTIGLMDLNKRKLVIPNDEWLKAIGAK
ncbi:MAG: acyl-CoA thioesterase [Bdellovibrionales bacterium]|nr:acyl-CoA thioesterase [Bdellovibrionales bacterium]